MGLAGGWLLLGGGTGGGGCGLVLGRRTGGDGHGLVLGRRTRGDRHGLVLGVKGKGGGNLNQRTKKEKWKNLKKGGKFEDGAPQFGGLEGRGSRRADGPPLFRQRVIGSPFLDPRARTASC